MAPTLAVELDGVSLTTPILIASGCAGTGREIRGLLDARRLGGLVSRSITVHRELGAPGPRVAETASGIVWDTGLQNPGIEYFLAEELPALAATGAPVIVSIAGTSLEEYVRLTSALHARQEVSAIEVHLSGPDLELRRPVLGARVDRASEIVGACARLSRVPVFPKVPFGGNLEAIAVACVRAGARGLTLVGPLPAGSAGGSSGLESAVGWLAGPAIKPLVLGAVRRMSQALPEVPIMASGGVRTTRDAVEMLAAGAWAVQVGTATLIDPQSPVEIARGILRYIRHQGLGSPADLRGAAVETASPRASE